MLCGSLDGRRVFRRMDPCICRLSPFPIHLNYHNIVNWLYSNTKQKVKMVKKKKKNNYRGNKEVRKGALGLQPLFLPPSVCIFRRASNSATLVQGIWYRGSSEEGPGKNIPFAVENKWRLLAMMTLLLGCGSAPHFFIVRPACSCWLHRSSCV